MFLFSLIVLCVLAMYLCFKFLLWMPKFLFWLLLLLIVLFFFTHLPFIILIIAIIWGVSYYKKSHQQRYDEEQFARNDRYNQAGPVDTDTDQNQEAGKSNGFFQSFQDRSVERVEKEFQDNQAFNLGDGLWIDQQDNRLLFVTKGKTSGYVQADFSDLQQYTVNSPSDYSKTFEVFLAGMPAGESLTVRLSTQENDWLGQSPSDYFQELLSRFAPEG